MATFQNEREIKYFEFDVDMTDKEKEVFIRYAREHILDDIPALINYAVVRLLENYIKDVKKTNKVLKKKVTDKKQRKKVTQ